MPPLRAATLPDRTLTVVLAALIALSAALVTAAPAGAADPRSPRPNIVVFMLDDIPALDGRLLKRLHHIRSTFIDDGIKFSDFHGETPTCCPGRAGFLTGLHTHHHGTTRPDGRLFKPGMTIATQLRKSGYHTIQVGKYLNRFDAIADKWPPGWSRFSGFGGAYYDYDMWTNGQRRHHGHARDDYSTDVITRLTMKALRLAPSQQKLFAWITPYAAHKPRTPAPRHKGAPKCRDIPRWKPPGYMEANVKDKPLHIRELPLRKPNGYDLRQTCEALQSVDQMVGKVVKRLKAQGRWNNTLLILTSDNGMGFGSQRVLWDKKVPYASQIPFYVRWPRMFGAQRRVIGERLQNIDLAPTLCDIAGCTLGPYPTGQQKPDGRSFLPLLTGARTRLARDAVLGSYRDTGKWVPAWWSVTTTASSELADRKCALKASGGCRWLYVEYATGAKELYDISNGPCWRWQRGTKGDPCRLRNRIGWKSHSAIKQALAQRLRQLR